jgi:Bcr/CflA subfamily drug resistance transporter
MYLPALPALVSDLNTTNILGQFTLTVWLLGTASFQLVLGPLSDIYGRRLVLLGGGLVFVMSTIICALACDIRLLLIARFFQGSAVCSVVVAGYATIHDLYNHITAVRIIALMGSIMVLGPACGPLVGSLVLYLATWRYIFWILAIWAALALLFLWKYMPETAQVNREDQFSLCQLLMGYYAVLKNKNFMFNTLAYCLLFCGMITWSSSGPFLIIESFHYSSLVFSILQATVYISFMLGSYYVLFNIKKIGTLKLIYLGLTCALVGSISMLLSAILYPHYLVGTILGMMIFTGGAAVASPLHRVAVETSQEGMGTRIAIFSSAMSSFGALGSIVGSVFYRGTSFTLAIIITLGTVLAIFLKWNISVKNQATKQGSLA